MLSARVQRAVLDGRACFTIMAAAMLHITAPRYGIAVVRQRDRFILKATCACPIGLG